jgi:hypothetical protein
MRESLLCLVVSFVVGLVVALLGGALNNLAVHQSGYAEGVRATLAKTVKVGGEGGPCAVEIPIGALADMVRIGVLDWHQECMRTIVEEK